MQEYLLAVHSVDGKSARADEDTELAYAETAKLNTELQAAGVWVFGGGLLPPDSATVVRIESGVATMTDGPFAETKEQLGGFWVLRCADLDEALAWAEKCSRACREPVEVRPFQPEPEPESAGPAS